MNCLYFYQCGEDFCDECGDCLVCHGDEPCYDDGPHTPSRNNECIWYEFAQQEHEAYQEARRRAAGST
jgi:hypothetical protein